METSQQNEFSRLKLDSTIGFGGNVTQGLINHPNRIHNVYSLGSTVIIGQNSNPKNQAFLQGHTNVVSCLAVSKDGSRIASGQLTHMGFQADILVWDFKTHQIIHRLTLHKVKVQALAFSPSGKYLASLGGQDDNSVIVWDLEKGVAICGASASKDSDGASLSLAYCNKDDLSFVTGGHGNLRVWQISPQDKKVRATDCQSGIIKRVVKCIIVDKDDEFMYCGTTTGDLMQVNLRTKLFKASGPPKERDLFSMGIISACLTPSGNAIMVGCGDGTVAELSIAKLTITQSTKLAGGVTSISFSSNSTFYAGTAKSNIYLVQAKDLSNTLMTTCHYTPANDIAFPLGASDVFATASDADVRIWNGKTGSEILRIFEPNLECKSITFNKAGSSLISGWNDAKIRAYGPQSGRLQYQINDAHKGVVTALAVTDVTDNQSAFRIVSGGSDGEVRVWAVNQSTRTLEASMKEHKGMVTCIKIRKNGLECVSSSSDGSCIIWDLTRFVRNQVLFAPSFFKAVSYYPDESQIITSGTDRKVAYWEAFDGSLIRELEASQSDTINTLDISANGDFFVIGGSDKVIKVYRYEEGDVKAIGLGHSTDITKLKISPDQSRVVSVSAEGAIFSWKL